MRACEVAVLGLGVMGSATLYALLRDGIDAIGFDPNRPGGPTGSSHGSCRVYRRFNFESVAYTGLGARAWDLWQALEAEHGREIIKPIPVLEAGPAGSSLVHESRNAALLDGRDAPLLTGAEVNARFAAFRLPGDWEAVVQDTGGVLLIGAALEAFQAPAEAAERIVRAPARFRPATDGVVVTAGGEQVLARSVVLTAGPWLGELLPEIAPYLRVTRQAVAWFSPDDPDSTGYPQFPIFILDGPEGPVYGFPNFEARGVKAAWHGHGAVADPDDWTLDPDPSGDDERQLGRVSRTLRTYVPGAYGDIVDRELCLYTNTLGSDLTPLSADQGKADEFMIDRLPSDPRIVVGSACSGHGAKFASAIGELLAGLACDPLRTTPTPFRIDRYAAFAEAETGRS